jgi:hypothetical protein
MVTCECATPTYAHGTLTHVTSAARKTACLSHTSSHLKLPRRRRAYRMTYNWKPTQSASTRALGGSSVLTSQPPVTLSATKQGGAV